MHRRAGSLLETNQRSKRLVCACLCAHAKKIEISGHLPRTVCIVRGMQLRCLWELGIHASHTFCDA